MNKEDFDSETSIYAEKDEVPQQQQCQELNQKNLFNSEEERLKESKSISDVDIWLQSVKSGILSLTKINQARAKRDINAILSNYEIEEIQNSTY